MNQQQATGVARHEDAFNHNLRTVAIVDFASMVGTDAFENSLDDAAESLIEYLLDTDYRVHPSTETLRKFALDADADNDVFAELLMTWKAFGFAVQFSTPVMTKTSARSWSFSWGYTQSTWIYADDYEKAWGLGVKWAEDCKAKAEKAKPARRKASRATPV